VVEEKGTTYVTTRRALDRVRKRNVCYEIDEFDTCLFHRIFNRMLYLEKLDCIMERYYNIINNKDEMNNEVSYH